MKTKKSKKVTAPVGRPTKYLPAVLRLADEYIALCVDEYSDYHKTQGLTSNSYERKIKVNLPTFEGLSLFLKVHIDTVQEWRSKHTEFSVTCRRIEALQKERLLSGGLSGDYNPMIAKLVLSANHGMKERVDNTTDDQPLPAPVTVNNFKNLSDDELIALTTGSAGRASK